MLSGDGAVLQWDTSVSQSFNALLVSDSEPIYGITKQRGKIVTGSRRATLRYYNTENI
jgi:hypothetical protein